MVMQFWKWKTFRNQLEFVHIDNHNGDGRNCAHHRLYTGDRSNVRFRIALVGALSKLAMASVSDITAAADDWRADRMISWTMPRQSLHTAIISPRREVPLASAVTVISDNESALAKRFLQHKTIKRKWKWNLGDFVGWRVGERIVRWWMRPIVLTVDQASHNWPIVVASSLGHRTRDCDHLVVCATLNCLWRWTAEYKKIKNKNKKITKIEENKLLLMPIENVPLMLNRCATSALWAIVEIRRPSYWSVHHTTDPRSAMA